MDENDELKPSEAARDRRRDRDAEARARAGMQTGLAKQFKQVLDVQRRRGENAERLLEERADEPKPTRARGKG
jgi:hypothetical protein